MCSEQIDDTTRISNIEHSKEVEQHHKKFDKNVILTTKVVITHQYTITNLVKIFLNFIFVKIMEFSEAYFPWGTRLYMLDRATINNMTEWIYVNSTLGNNIISMFAKNLLQGMTQCVHDSPLLQLLQMVDIPQSAPLVYGRTSIKDVSIRELDQRGCVSSY